MKKWIMSAIFFVLVFILFAPLSLRAQEQNKVYISFFYGNGCPHCAREELFLEKLGYDFDTVVIRRYEVWYNRENAALMAKVARELKIAGSSVPLTIIGDEAISGYLNDATTGARIRRIVLERSASGCSDTVDAIDSGARRDDVACVPEKEEGTVILPMIGSINLAQWSLPLLTIVIAGLDGFNPCAMWVLVFLISLLISMQDRKKMWILGSAFIAASGAVYFLFLSAWLNLFLFLGFIAAIRIIIGLVALGSGAYHLKEWWYNREGVCKVGDMEHKQKIMDKFRRIVSEQNFYFALAGIVAIAVSVNLVELVCSAGLPAIYTNVLAHANLSPISHYLYLILYIFIFMLDDMLIFVIAMTTLRITGMSAKYSRWSNLLGGIIISILGLLLIFKPGWVMFG